MNNLRREIRTLVKELNDLKKLIEENMKIDDKPLEKEKITDILSNVQTISNNF